MHLIWKIAAGVVLGVLVLGFLVRCSDAVVEAGLEAQRQQHEQDPTRIVYVPRPAQIPMAPAVPAPPATPAIPDGLRCIHGLLFEKLPNGFAQITDGRVQQYCGSSR